MSKKTLLKEATVRRFMKLANVGSLTDNFISEGGFPAAYDEDEPELEGEELSGEELSGEELPGEELPGEELSGDDSPAEVLPPEPGEDAEEVEITEEERDALAIALPALEKIVGRAVGGEEPLEEPLGDEEEVSMVGGDEAQELEEADDVEVVSEEELVKEVTRRVAARLRSVLKSKK